MDLLLKMAFLVIIFSIHIVLTRTKPTTEGYRRMLNGKPVSIKDWPFLAQLKFIDGVEKWKICSATITGRDELITAAHCVRNVTKTGKLELLQVNIPTRKHSQRKSDEYKLVTTRYEVEKIMIDPESSPESWDNDTALIKLKRPVPDYIKPIPIAGSRDDKLRNCKSAGWGSTNFNGTPKDVETGNYEISETLQEIGVSLVPLEQCKDFWTTKEMFAKNNDRVFCGGEIGTGNTNVQGACYGDSGSPLICDSHKGKVFKGVLLGGHPGCKPGGEYTIFADLAKKPVWV
eukprot:Seg1700.3 transcript_id=Seg1700.3/GoldUCD/mRNA.D3Y31 product="Kallikrein 1-related peptidase b26" protein_id=Seg1700.3/GoldUCD/D3Y31